MLSARDAAHRTRRLWVRAPAHLLSQAIDTCGEFVLCRIKSTGLIRTTARTVFVKVGIAVRLPPCLRGPRPLAACPAGGAGAAR